MKLSVIIPAHNEEACIKKTVFDIVQELTREHVSHEIIVVNDGSTDQTESVLKDITKSQAMVRYINNEKPNGFGLAVRKGLEVFTGDCAAIVMGDGSDSPANLVQYFRKIEEGYECVFGSRFIKESVIKGYPAHKLILNRMANYFIRALFRLPYNDITNAFKCYRRNVIEGIEPLFSNHFNLTVEMPLKAIVRGYSYAVIPISWTNRQTGVSKLKIKEMGSRYLFIVLHLFLEKTLSCGDYFRKDKSKPEVKVDL